MDPTNITKDSDNRNHTEILFSFSNLERCREENVFGKYNNMNFLLEVYILFPFSVYRLQFIIAKKY